MCSLLGQILQQLQLVTGEGPISTGRQITQTDWPEADSFQTHDFVANACHQPANLTVLTLVEHDFQIRTVADRLLQTHPSTWNRPSSKYMPRFSDASVSADGIPFTWHR